MQNSRFFFSSSSSARLAAETGHGSLSSWSDVGGLEELLQPDETSSRSSARSNLDSEKMESGSATAFSSRQQITNGLNSLPLTESSTSKGDDADSEDIDSRLTKSLDLAHGSLQRLSSEPGVSDSMSTSSIDYVWDADEVPGRRKFHSLPHGGVYATTANGSLPGSPLSTRRAEGPDQTEKLKTKLMAAWNNMRHGWTMRRTTSFKYDEPIWLLGNFYHTTIEEREDQRIRQQRGHQTMTSMERFKRDFTSRLWFTYRQNFIPLPNSQYTTDVGWGCMIRTGQMMLAQALLMHFLGRDWRWYPQQRPQDVIYHHQIIRLFGDSPGPDSPFSLHKLVQIGQQTGKNPGDWYGPASVAHVLSEAVLQNPANALASQICVYVAQDCTVYKQDVLDLCAMMGSRRSSFRARHSSSTSEEARPLTPSDQSPDDRTPGDRTQTSTSTGLDDPWKALVILVPVRLGGEMLNPVYASCVQIALTNRMCLGVIGGKPKHSVYFIGWQGDKLIYLDPHFCQDVIDVSNRNFPVHSYHCMSPRKLPFNKMDPSCTLGFYCKTRLDFEAFIREVPQLAAPPTNRGHYPMFVVSEGRSCDISYPMAASPSSLKSLSPSPPMSPGLADRPPRPRSSKERLNPRMRGSSKESDDFVFL